MEYDSMDSGVEVPNLSVKEVFKGSISLENKGSVARDHVRLPSRFSCLFYTN